MYEAASPGAPTAPGFALPGFYVIHLLHLLETTPQSGLHDRYGLVYPPLCPPTPANPRLSLAYAGHTRKTPILGRSTPYLSPNLRLSRAHVCRPHQIRKTPRNDFRSRRKHLKLAGRASRVVHGNAGVLNRELEIFPVGCTGRVRGLSPVKLKHIICKTCFTVSREEGKRSGRCGCQFSLQQSRGRGARDSANASTPTATWKGNNQAGGGGVNRIRRRQFGGGGWQHGK